MSGQSVCGKLPLVELLTREHQNRPILIGLMWTLRANRLRRFVGLLGCGMALSTPPILPFTAGKPIPGSGLLNLKDAALLGILS